MYTNASIGNDIWLKVRSVRISHALPDERLLCLGRIHLALHELNACIRRDDTAEKATAMLQRIRRLSDECVARCRECDDLGRLARFVPLLYRLARPCLVPVKDGWLNRCDTIAERLVDLWVKKETCPWEEEHAAMKAVTELAGFLGETARENDTAYRKYRDRLAGWNRAFSANDRWEGISDAEALGRLSLLQDSPVYGGLVRHYKEQILRKGIPSETYLPLLDLATDAGCQTDMDESLVDGIQHAAGVAIRNSSAKEKDHWFLLAVLAECCRVREARSCLL